MESNKKQLKKYTLCDKPKRKYVKKDEKKEIKKPLIQIDDRMDKDEKHIIFI